MQNLSNIKKLQSIIGRTDLSLYLKDIAIFRGKRMVYILVLVCIFPLIIAYVTYNMSFQVIFFFCRKWYQYWQMYSYSDIIDHVLMHRYSTFRLLFSYLSGPLYVTYNITRLSRFHTFSSTTDWSYPSSSTQNKYKLLR